MLGVPASRVDVQPTSYELIAKISLEHQFYARDPIGLKSPAVRIEQATDHYHQKPI